MTQRQKTDVTIIGGGIAGICAAFHLVRRGAKVVLLESGAVGSQASGVNFGGLRANQRAEAELPLSLRAQAQWREVETLVGNRCDVAFTGHIEMGDRPEHIEGMETWAAMARGHGLKPVFLSGKQIAERYPFINRKMIAGCLLESDGSGNPRLAAPSFGMVARRMGADIRENTAAHTVARVGQEFLVEASDGTTIQSSALVNAAGAWGARIAAQLGEAFPLELMAPQLVVSEPLPYVVGPTMEYPVNGRFFYFRQIPRGNLIFGRGPGRADLETRRAAYVPQNVFDASRIAMDLLPMLRGRSFLRSWSGVESKTPDLLPIFGRSRVADGLIHAFGFSGHGFQLGPGTGAVIADLVLDGRSETRIDGLDPYRFGPRPQLSSH